ncbi:hypothetical protein HYH02_002306 [Chlamydomonas schloesseri]|uniref:C1q domain-containing protein n=1 Tax=Chlamydomonas schloesseri TaxID=2026947 RepID=A0A835WRT2_9CHLO|nr:hypothetical protein HYH02_002306 [Chlamydomonas schloesseri]|eukprot:KAG2452969.1 hypothetical protein HYH02_002306 [Chlamydomonas schloesseri]
MPMPSNSLVLEDLTQGLNEWRNIQDIVRLTFKAFHDVLRAQGDAIKAIERAVDTKASRAEVTTGLQQKANVSDMAARIRELETLLATKADISDMERRALKTEVDASLRTQMSDVYTLLRQKTEDAEFKAFKEHADRQLSGLRADVSRLGSGMEATRTALDGKAGLAEVSAALAQKADLAEVDDKLRDKVSRKMFQEGLARKADLAQLDQTEARLGQELADLRALAGRKADATALEEVSNRTERLRQRVEADSDTTAAALRTISATFDNTLADVRGRLEGCSTQLASLHRNMGAFEQQLREVDVVYREALSKKADAVEVYRLLDRKADAAAVSEALSHKAGQETVDALLSKVDGALDLAGRVDALQRDVDTKLNEAKNLYSAMEGLARVEDVNKALLEVCAELENKAPVSEVVRLERQQGVINSGFAQNLHMARWLWKSTRTKAGNAVPWEVQAVNTDTDNFVWEEGKATIVTVAPGLYEVSFGFYPATGAPRLRRTPPLIQLLVNGEVALTGVFNPTTIQHGSGGSALPGNRSPRLGSASSTAGGSSLALSPGMDNRATSTTGLTSSPVTGMTAWDVLTLPAKAKIAVTYQGEERGEGFLGLRKL